MTLTSGSIYSKSLLWAIIGGGFVAAIFYIIVDVGNLFTGQGSAYLETLLYVTMVGEYLGSGLVGWRIVDKYHNHRTKKFMRNYIQFSVLTMILGIGIVYTPVSVIDMLWFFVAPACVLLAYNKSIPLKKRQ